jgi:DNA-binding transcriptional regulator YdaS (Cro superfamily)
MDKHPIDVAAEIMGSQVALASALGVTKAAVSQWKDKGRRVPAEHCPAIERLTNGVIRCEQLRPDVAWDVLRAQAGTEAPAERANTAPATSRCEPEPEPEPSEAPMADGEVDLAGAPKYMREIAKLIAKRESLTPKKPDRDGPGARDERLRGGHAGAGNRERHPS